MRGILLHTLLIMLTSFSARAEQYCPKTAKEWQEWRERVVLNYKTPDAFTSRIKTLYACEGVPSQQKFFRNPQFTSCMKELRLLDGSERSLKEEALAPKKFQDLGNPIEAIDSEEFANALSQSKQSRDGINKFILDLRKKFPESKIIGFRSATTDPKSKNIVIVIPGKFVDQWIAIEDKEAEGLRRGFLQISVLHHRNDGKVLEPPIVAFKDYFLARNAKTNLTPRGHFKDASISFNRNECTACHRTGPMPIVPDPSEPVVVYGEETSAKNVLSWINSRVVQVANAIPEGKYLEGRGPMMGPKFSQLRTPAFIKDCIRSAGGEINATTISRVKNAMNCAQCHDSTFAGPLSYPLGLDETPELLLKWMIQSGHMPPSEKGKLDLSQSERDALYLCITREYYGGMNNPRFSKHERGLFVQNLLKVSCPDQVSELEATSDSLRKSDSESVEPIDSLKNSSSGMIEKKK